MFKCDCCGEEFEYPAEHREAYWDNGWVRRELTLVCPSCGYDHFYEVEEVEEECGN